MRQSSTVCPHCGADHTETTCPETGQSTLDPGPCGTRVGGFGAVYRARHVHTLRDVAIKLIDRVHVNDVGTLERFKHEAQIAAAIASPYIVQVLDWGIQPSGQAFLVMELLEGRDLADLLADGPLPAARALELAGQILAALGAVHAAGAIHRDVKPANVFLARDGGVKLIDFGCGRAEWRDAQLTKGATLGTPQYMAPEQMRAGTIDARADVYATAVVVYEMLSGRRPHAGASYEDLVARVCTEPPEPLAVPDLPAHVTTAIMRGLERDPERRWPSATAFARALQGDPGSAETVKAAPPTAKTVKAVVRRRRAGRWIWPAAIGVALAVSIVVWQTAGGSAPATTPVPVLGAVCTSDAQCPMYLCHCADEPLRATGCADGHCLTPAFCATTCLAAGGGGSDYEVASPMTDADCTAAPACRTHGKCLARFDAADSLNYCVASCRELDACNRSGMCTDVRGTCVATTDADCKASKYCRAFGSCSLVSV